MDTKDFANKTRILKCLAESGICTAKELEKLNGRELLNVPGIKSLQDAAYVWDMQDAVKSGKLYDWLAGGESRKPSESSFQ